MRYYVFIGSYTYRAMRMIKRYSVLGEKISHYESHTGQWVKYEDVMHIIEGKMKKWIELYVPIDEMNTFLDITQIESIGDFGSTGTFIWTKSGKSFKTDTKYTDLKKILKEIAND